MTGDALWRVKVYRLSLFVCYIGWEDTGKIAADKRAQSLSSQLYRSLGSIGANIAEGYSRSSARERAHFIEYALGSARESRDWYYKASHILSEPVIEHRLNLLTDIIRLLLKMLADERGKYAIEEDIDEYEPGSTSEI
jgi:four helix bundle protein